MSHSDTILQLPGQFELTARTEDIPIAAFESKSLNYYGLQFHPEVYHTVQGKQILENFLKNICHCQQDWTPAHFITQTIGELRENSITTRLSWVYQAEWIRLLPLRSFTGLSGKTCIAYLLTMDCCEK
jgi:hypothetical protein